MTRDEPSKVFNCPICLAEKQVVAAKDDGSREHQSAAAVDAVDQSGNPIFQLSSCNHLFCASCLRAYVRSKLMDGEYILPCCCSLNDEESCHTCKAIIEESDVYRLVHMDMDDLGESASSWFHKSSDSNIHFAFDNDSKSHGLWEKYQKLKFDAHHGKDCVRRCPKCDEAALFDKESMKAFQSRFLTEHAPPQTTGRSAGPTRNMNQFERALSLFREWRRGNYATSRQNDNTNSTSTAVGKTAMQKREVTKDDDEHQLKALTSVPTSAPHNPDEEATDETTMQKELSSKDNESLNCTICTLHTTPGADEEACIPVDGKDNDESTSEGSKSLEASVASLTSEAKKEGETESTVKSTTPVVTCRNCRTEFCYFHSNAHSGKSCIEYHKEHLETDRSNIECINQILRAKPCPNCGISVSKEGGCNQMKCGSCGIHFCWICGEIV